jgi:hypothetical protein
MKVMCNTANQQQPHRNPNAAVLKVVMQSMIDQHGSQAICEAYNLVAAEKMGKNAVIYIFFFVMLELGVIICDSLCVIFTLCSNECLTA